MRNIKMLRKTGLALVGSLLVFSIGASAAEKAGKTTTKVEKVGVTASDLAFMKGMARGGLLEVKLGELAEKNAASEAVREFGSRMVKDHSAASESLKTV